MSLDTALPKRAPTSTPLSINTNLDSGRSPIPRAERTKPKAATSPPSSPLRPKSPPKSPPKVGLNQLVESLPLKVCLLQVDHFVE